jgi:hypothetical protein
MDNETLAKFHLETACKLTSRAFIQAWLEANPVIKEKRGRKPGAATDEMRCSWLLSDENQCKNTKQDGSSFCRMHINKIQLVD